MHGISGGGGSLRVLYARGKIGLSTESIQPNDVRWDERRDMRDDDGADWERVDLYITLYLVLFEFKF